MHHRSVPLLSAVLLLLAGLLAGCSFGTPSSEPPPSSSGGTAAPSGGEAPSTPADAPTAAPAGSAPSKPQQIVNVVSGLQSLNTPPDLKSLGYAPGAGGSSTCNSAPLPNTNQAAGNATDVKGPLLFLTIPADILNGPPEAAASQKAISSFTSGLQVGLGDSLVMCYFHISPGAVKEQVIDPDGKSIRTIEFSITAPNSVYGNDFQIFPTDKAGTYTIVAQTPDGELKAQYVMTGQPPALARPNATAITTISRAPQASMPNTSEVEYLALKGFSPNEAVRLYFYESCNPPTRAAPGSWPWGGRFHYGAQAKVNDSGWTFVPLAGELSQHLDSALGYFVTAARERSGAGAPISGVTILPNIAPSGANLVPDLAGFAIMQVKDTSRVSPTGGVLGIPACESIQAQAPLPATASGDALLLTAVLLLTCAGTLWLLRRRIA